MRMDYESKHKRYIFKDELKYTANCANIPVVTQGDTIGETNSNLQEVVSLYFEDEDLHELGFQSYPTIVITFPLQPLAHTQ